MEICLKYAKDFNQDISGWNVPSSRVTTGLDTYASAGTNHSNDIFNDSDLYYFTINHTPITDKTVLEDAINDWIAGGLNPKTNMDIILLIGMYQMSQKMNGLFKDNTSFNEDISGWNVSNVTTLWETFMNSTNFNQPLGANNFGTGDDLPANFGTFSDANGPIYTIHHWA
ncbi:MAG: hypothetical protein Ct9H90mP28_1090 [Paracoccaceae bacterium]|nr:MAG: hypothetical protein Ct9H90mP28_1090 [Paracoccaceae bacterium]